jgi:hypothetical protein
MEPSFNPAFTSFALEGASLPRSISIFIRGKRALDKEDEGEGRRTQEGRREKAEAEGIAVLEDLGGAVDARLRRKLFRKKKIIKDDKERRHRRRAGRI